MVSRRTLNNTIHDFDSDATKFKEFQKLKLILLFLCYSHLNTLFWRVVKLSFEFPRSGR